LGDYIKEIVLKKLSLFKFIDKIHNMDNEFKNKKIFISGGTNGIGYDIAKYFL
jgi:short-subunit dehydrogenase involved in D-alanine esterification of teichoic acids